MHFGRETSAWSNHSSAFSTHSIWHILCREMSWTMLINISNTYTWLLCTLDAKYRYSGKLKYIGGCLPVDHRPLSVVLEDMFIKECRHLNLPLNIFNVSLCLAMQMIRAPSMFTQFSKCTIYQSLLHLKDYLHLRLL